jgi:hypothetical protein
VNDAAPEQGVGDTYAAGTTGAAVEAAGAGGAAGPTGTTLREAESHESVAETDAAGASRARRTIENVGRPTGAASAALREVDPNGAAGNAEATGAAVSTKAKRAAGRAVRSTVSTEAEEQAIRLAARPAGAAGAPGSGCGNKRTARLMMVGELISQGFDLVSFPFVRQLELNQALDTLFRAEDATHLLQFLGTCVVT